MEEDYLLDAALVAILNDGSDDEDEDDGNYRRVQRINVDIEGWRVLDGMAFQRDFRMKRATFQLLIFEVGNHLRRQGKLRWSRTPLDISLLYATWSIFNPDCFRSVGRTFGKGGSSIHHHYLYLIAAIGELSDNYVKWPSAGERYHIKIQFEQTYGYPGVVLCIDGTYFEISAPSEQKQAYITRHHTYAYLCQAACDHNMLIRDTFIGMPGSVGDRRTFTESPLYQSLLRTPEALRDDEHILGDCAYPLLKNLLVPYINDGNLSARRRRHNYELSKVRSSVERTFALLFGSMRRSKHHHVYSWLIAINHGLAAIVLHNFRIVHEKLDDVERAFFEVAAPLGRNYVLQGREEDLLQESALMGALKREYIASLFHNDE